MQAVDLNPDIITREEGYWLTVKYVTYLWNKGKFYSLAYLYSKEDIINTLYIKFLEQRLFEKYSSNILSKESHIFISVQRSMIDLFKKHARPNRKRIDLPLSLQQEITEDGLIIEDQVGDDIDIERDILGQMQYAYIIDLLPDNTNLDYVGKSPYFGDVNMSMRVIALHLYLGMSKRQIAEMYVTGNYGTVYRKLNNEIQRMQMMIKRKVISTS